MAIYPIILHGEKIVKNLKEFYFKDENWTPELSKKTTAMLTCLTRAAKPFFPEVDAEGVMFEVSKFSKQDMDDVFGQNGFKFSIEDKSCDNLGQPKNIGADIWK